MFCLPVPTLIYLREIYIFSGSVCLFCCREICGQILGIYKWLTDTWMWKLGLRPPRKGIHKWNFPCSVPPDRLLQLDATEAQSMAFFFFILLNGWFPCVHHEVHIYLEYHSGCRLVRIGTTGEKTQHSVYSGGVQLMLHLHKNSLTPKPLSNSPSFCQEQCF